MLTSIQDFAAAILAPEPHAPYGTAGPDGKPSAARFAIYRNNVLVGLCEALKAAYPVVCRIVGDEFFRAMARAYAMSEPPQSPIMLNYGAGFPSFIRAFDPAAQLPYLNDVARLEWAWVEAYHAAEAGSLGRSELASLDSQRAHAVVFKLHPSTRIVRSPFPSLTIWRTNVANGVPEAVDLHSGGEDALLTRPVAEVEVRQLPLGAAAFIQALEAGATVSGDTACALDDEPSFDLPSAITGLIESGAIAGYDIEAGLYSDEEGSYT